MHWTYRAANKTSDLEQGDILESSPALRSILRQVHQYFDHDKYTAFVVTTQSCDLVERPKTKARYVSIAAVRSLHDVGSALIAQVAKSPVRGLAAKSSKSEVRGFLSRLVDQNEQAHGLFYLHPDSDIGLADPSIVFLRVTVSLLADHIPELKAARMAHLDPEFRGKFGWLLGNLYSRAAARDWADTAEGAAEVKRLLRSYLDPTDGTLAPVWIEDELLQSAQRAGYDMTEKAIPQILEDLEKFKARPKAEVLAEEVAEVIRRMLPEPLSAEQLTTLKNRLANNGVVSRLVR